MLGTKHCLVYKDILMCPVHVSRYWRLSHYNQYIIYYTWLCAKWPISLWEMCFSLMILDWSFSFSYFTFSDNNNCAFEALNELTSSQPPKSRNDISLRYAFVLFVTSCFWDVTHCLSQLLFHKKIMDCFERPNREKKLTDAQKGRLVSLRFDGHHSIESIAELINTSVSSSFFSTSFANNTEYIKRVSTRSW